MTHIVREVDRPGSSKYCAVGLIYGLYGKVLLVESATNLQSLLSWYARVDNYGNQLCTLYY